MTEEIRLDMLVAEAVTRAIRHAPDARFDVELEETVVSGVPARLDRAVNNVLDNAVKFAGTERPIEVRLAGGELTVRDHGPGIEAGDLPHVFDRFYRGASARALPGSGARPGHRPPGGRPPPRAGGDRGGGGRGDPGPAATAEALTAGGESGGAELGRDRHEGGRAEAQRVALDGDQGSVELGVDAREPAALARRKADHPKIAELLAQLGDVRVDVAGHPLRGPGRDGAGRGEAGDAGGGRRADGVPAGLELGPGNGGWATAEESDDGGHGGRREPEGHVPPPPHPPTRTQAITPAGVCERPTWMRGRVRGASAEAVVPPLVVTARTNPARRTSATTAGS